MLLSIALNLLLVFNVYSKVSVEGSDFFKSQVELVNTILPSNFFNKLKRPVLIREKKLDQVLSEDSDLCNLDERVILGQTRKKRRYYELTIHSKLIQLAKESSKEFTCFHKNFKSTLNATLLHELMHVKDFEERISQRIQFQGLIGVKRIRKYLKTRILNQNVKTSLDPYEFNNPSESLATNFEFYILDPSYACRKPAYATFFDEIFDLNKIDECQVNSRILTQSSFLEDNYGSLVDLNPDRVFEIHYLYADKASQIMSRWGHSMFRLIVCAPHRKVVDENCLKDVSSHLVISYKALIKDLRINYAYGLRGKYPSQMFISKFAEALLEYNKLEFRDLYSLPLNLDRKEIKKFIYLTIERYWSYKSQYYFVTNNCATELLKHLAFSVSENKMEKINALTPKGIFKRLLKNKDFLLNHEAFSQRKILYPSLEASYRSSYQRLLEEDLTLGLGFSRFLYFSNPSDRMKMYANYFSNKKISKLLRHEILNHVLKIERFLLIKLNYQIPPILMEHIHNLDSSESDASKLILNLQDINLSPWDIFDIEYGIPLISEMERQIKLFFEKRDLIILNFIQDQKRMMNEISQEGPLLRELQNLKDSLILNEWLSNLMISYNGDSNE